MGHELRTVDLDVEVLDEGRWCFDVLKEWRLEDDGWYGWVKYTRAPSETLIATFYQNAIRPAEGTPAPHRRRAALLVRPLARPGPETPRGRSARRPA